MRKTNIISLTESAVLVAFATVLSMIKLWEAPLGGAVTLFSMVPIIVISYRRGIMAGILSGLCYSFIQLILGVSNLSYIPSAFGVICGALFDYIVPFTILGAAGLVSSLPIASHKLRAALGTLAVCILRFISHFAVGGFIWYEITKNLGWNEYVTTVGTWTYSFVYNITYLLPEIVICIIGVVLLPKKFYEK